jgi:hypothetical protein
MSASGCLILFARGRSAREPMGSLSPSSKRNRIDKICRIIRIKLDFATW